MVAVRRVPEFAQGLPKTRAAVAYAERLHEGQCRQVDAAPFILHPLEVASLLFHAGAPDHVIAAGALHGALEKTEATASDLTARFGPQVAALVTAVSEDAAIKTYANRKAALRHQVAGASREAAMVFAADKLSKVRELHLPGATVASLRKRRLTHYRSCLELLQQRLPTYSLVSALERELASLPEARRRTRALSKAH